MWIFGIIKFAIVTTIGFGPFGIFVCSGAAAGFGSSGIFVCSGKR